MIRCIVFDFDGTLVDTKPVFISAYNQLARKYGFRSIESSNLEELKRLSLWERFSFLQVPLYKLPLLTREFLFLYRLQLKDIHFVPGLEAVLDRLARSGVQMAILSSNATSIIESFLLNHGLRDLFTIYCSGQLSKKDRIMRRLLKQKNLHSSEILYVCDEKRDLEACRRMNITPVWVEWGFETKAALEDLLPAHTAATPGDLLSVFQAHLPLLQVAPL